MEVEEYSCTNYEACMILLEMRNALPEEEKGSKKWDALSLAANLLLNEMMHED